MLHRRNSKRIQRALSMLLAVITLMSLFTNVAYARLISPNSDLEGGSPGGGVGTGAAAGIGPTWIKFTEGERTGQDFNDFNATVVSELNRLDGLIQNGHIEGGLQYKGIRDMNDNASITFVAEDITKFLIACWAADSTQMEDHANLFYHTAGFGGYDDYPLTVNAALDAYKTAIVGRYAFGSVNASWMEEYPGHLTTAVVNSEAFRRSTSSDLITPGQGNFSSAAQKIIRDYFQGNVASIIAGRYLSSGEIAIAGVEQNNNSDNSDHLMSYISGKLGSGGLLDPDVSTGNQDAPAEGELDLSGGQEVGDLGEVPFPTTYTKDNALFIVDTAAADWMLAAGWIDSVEAITGGGTGSFVPDTTNTAPKILVLNPNWSDSASNSYAGVFGANTANLFSAEDKKNITQVYVILGTDKARYDTLGMTFGNGTDYSSFKDSENYSKFCTSLQEDITNLVGNGGADTAPRLNWLFSQNENPVYVSVLQASPYSNNMDCTKAIRYTNPEAITADLDLEDSSYSIDQAHAAAAARVNNWNDTLNINSKAILPSNGVYDGVYYRALAVDYSTGDTAAAYKNNINTAISHSNKISTSPYEIGAMLGDYDAQAVWNLYYYNSQKLDPYLRSYQSIMSYYRQWAAIVYADSDNGSGTSVPAYYQEMEEPTLQMHPLFEALATAYSDGEGYVDPNELTPTQYTDPGNTELDHDQIQNADDALTLLSNAHFERNEVVFPNDDSSSATLTNIGYIALAAEVIYDPFVSIAGSDSYFSLVKHLLAGEDEDDIAKIEKLLHEAYMRKKPLYVLDGARDDWADEDKLSEAAAGTYRYASLADVLQSTTAATRIYSVAKGGMEASTVDSSTWEYYEGETKDDAGTTDDGVTIKSQGKTTVAGGQLTATAQDMSAPVMFTSGAKTALFSGNWEGSGKGYASCVGGLTTVIVHNAAQDAKDNDAVKYPENYMLFMNGLGDIVLDDGTIVLPALANPAIYKYDTINYDTNSTVAQGIFGGSVSGVVLGGMVAFFAPEIAGVAAAVTTILGIGIGDAALINWIDLAAGTGSSDESIRNVYNETAAYYPYTATFMNHYPSVIINVAGKLSVVNKNDEGKFVIGIDEQGNILARAIKSLSSDTQVNLEYAGGGVTIAPVQGLSFNVTSNFQKINTALPYTSGKDGTFITRFNTARKFDYFMTKDTIFTSDDMAFFPLNEDTADLRESYFKIAGPLFTSAKRFICARETIDETNVPFKAFNAERYVKDMCGQGLMGTQYAETLQKNYQISYDELVADQGNRLLSFLVQIVSQAVDTLGSIDGVLAIKNGYENKFFNVIVQFVQQFYLIIVVVLMIIVATKFLRGHYNMIYVCFIAALCFCGFEVYANWMPTVVPSLYNFAVNDSVEQIAWNTVVVSAESYAETYLDSNRKDATSGAPKPYTATITLYKLGQTDLDLVAETLNTTPLALKSGEIHYLDETAGIFVQGDAIKMSVDRLLVSNTMRGLYQSQWEELEAGITESDDFITPITDDEDKINNPYSIQLTQPFVSLEAYYMPFNEIERAFMVNLNTFASVFRFERNQFNYSKNLYKDAFLFNCYTNSGLFTAPGDRDVLSENIRVGSVVGSTVRFPDSSYEYQFLLNRIYGGANVEPLFPYPEDWLNFAAVLRSPSENMKDSLWGHIMQERGWYTLDWEINDPRALGDLVDYVNTQTKQFVIDNSSQLNYCSDENAIKLVSLYATTCFTHYVSEFGEWLYPNYLNAADIELRDVLYGSMTTLKDRNTVSDGTVVNTVARKLGVFGVLFILIITVFSVVFVFTVTYLIPILYGMLGVIIIYKLINDTNSLGLVQGYIKVSLVTAVLYFIFSLSLRLVEVGGYAWYGYLGCAILMYLCCYFLFWVVLSVIQNAGELGNDVLGQNLLHGLDKLTHGAVRKLTANMMQVRRHMPYGNQGYPYPIGSPALYGRGRGIDDRDYARVSRRGFFRRNNYGRDYGGYGRGYSYDETVYEQESRRGLFGAADRFFHRGDRREGDQRPSGAGGSSGMGRYANHTTTHHIRQQDISRLDEDRRR